MFEKIAHLAKVAAEFPEFKNEFKKMICHLASDKGSHKEPSDALLNECCRLYEEQGKLSAVKYWKDQYQLGLMDAKISVEGHAAKFHWIQYRGD